MFYIRFYDEKNKIRTFKTFITFEDFLFLLFCNTFSIYNFWSLIFNAIQL